MLRIIKNEISLRACYYLVATLKSLKIHKRKCLKLLENLRKKESVVSEHAHGRFCMFST